MDSYCVLQQPCDVGTKRALRQTDNAELSPTFVENPASMSSCVYLTRSQLRTSGLARVVEGLGICLAKSCLSKFLFLIMSLTLPRHCQSRVAP